MHAERLTWCAQTLAIITYMFGDWFSSSFVNVFVVCVLLLAFDFWTVKNVSGRLMVGLRWWSEVQDDGSQHWRFEAQEVRLRPRLPGPLPPRCGRRRCAAPPTPPADAQENLQSTTLDIGVFWVGLIAPARSWSAHRAHARGPAGRRQAAQGQGQAAQGQGQGAEGGLGSGRRPETPLLRCCWVAPRTPGLLGDATSARAAATRARLHG